MRTALNVTLWSALIIVGVPIFGSPAGLLGEYWFWWPSQAKAQVVNSLAIFGFGAFAIGGWAAINKPDRGSVGAALVLLVLVAVGVGFATVDCTYLFRCP